MAGGTGDEVSVAGTSKRVIVWPLKMSLPGCHHSGATPVAGPGGTHAVPVQYQAWRLVQRVAPSVAAPRVSSSPTPRAAAPARSTRAGAASRPRLVTTL